VVSFPPRPLYPKGKIPWYPLDKRLGGPQSWSGNSGEEKNSQPLPGFKPSIIQTVVQSYITELSGYRRDKKRDSILVGKLEGKSPLGRHRRRCKDNIRMDLREIE
jgi:hypothetical protein